MIRLDKYLAQMGIGSRQEVKNYIRKGKVSMDGNVVTQPDYKVMEDQTVCFDGREISYVTYEYYMLHKPAGVVSATIDNNDTTVLELIESKKRKDLFPVGRLDKDTEGLLLITNDGGLAHRLLSPRKHVDKRYYAKIEGKVTIEDVEAFEKGMNIGGEEEEWTLPASLCILSSGDISEIQLTIREGKYHQIKRMFHVVNKEVLYLKRESMGSLELDDTLQPGEYRRLTDMELENL